MDAPSPADTQQKKGIGCFMRLVGGAVMLASALVIALLAGRSEPEAPAAPTKVVPAVARAPEAPQVATPQVAVPQVPADTRSALELIGSDYTYSEENVEAFCKDEWTKRGVLNRRMYRHCAGTQKKAHRSLVSLVKKHASMNWLGDQLRVAWERWSKRGMVQYSLVNHDLEREIEAFLDIEYEKNQDSYVPQVMLACEKRRLSHERPFTMTMHCYEQALGR